MIENLMETLAFVLGVTGPIFLVVALGVLLKRVQLINDEFIHSASRLVFNVALPALLFFSIVKADLDEVLNPTLLLLACGGTLSIFILLSLLAPVVVEKPRDRGVFIQGSFRGNLGIVGLAFCVNAYGEQGLAAASMLMAVLTVLYNILSVYTLNRSLSEQRSPGVVEVVSGILRNPLILSIVEALILGALNLNLHPALVRTGEYFSQMTLPLALLCIGGSLSVRRNSDTLSVCGWAAFFKLILVPLLLAFLVYAAGYRGMDLGLVFLMASTPTAAASFVMVQALKGNAALAANIVVFTTLGSVVTVSLGLLVLKSLNLV